MDQKNVAIKRRANADEKSDLAYDAAKMYYEQGRTQQQIAKAMGFKYPSSVARLIKYARATRIVVIDVKRKIQQIDERPIRNRNLEGDLIKRFDLVESIVVDNVGYKGNFDKDEDERIHRVVGKALAEELRSVFRPKDYIGILGGRGTYYTTLALNEPQVPRLNQPDVVVTSLGGNVKTTASEDKIPVDADEVAYQLFRAFARGAEFRKLGIPVAVSESRLKNGFLKKGTGLSISLDQWREDKSFVPDIVLLGIGALDLKSDYHRFLHLGLELDAVQILLQELLDIMNTLDYCPVGDIGYRLFAITAPQDMRMNKKGKSKIDNKITELIGELNKRIISINEDQLRMVGRVIAIAGGPAKVDAIYEVLRKAEPKPLLHQLCTDRYTADKLIRRDKGEF